MAQSTGLQFTVQVGALADSTFVVASFKLDEGLNSPFSLKLEVASHQPDIDFGAVLDQPCELLVWYNGELQRRVCGVVSEFAQGDSGFRRTRYSLEVKPALWRLGLRQNSRIFQAQKPDEILSILLQEHGITDYAFALKNEHAQREYCVQYRETDLKFVNRLAAEEGLLYFHEFEQGKHRIVFADDAAALTAGPELFFNLGNRSLEQGPYVRKFHYRESVRPAEVELKDYSFKTPAYGLSHKKQGSELEHQRDTYQHFDYPGRYKQDLSGKAFAQHRLDALRNDAMMSSGQSNCAALLPGQTFTLSEHRNAALNIAWQIVHIRHTGTQPQALEEEGGSGPTVYHNEFGVVKASTTWRAHIGSPEAPHKPMVDGPQIAIVVGPEGEEIYCDEHGRVKLQFPWDRYGSSNDQSSCWVRVSQGWAGGQYGMMAIPRIGHEVIVSFLEGDPDQPIVTGRTYHATNRPPYELPANKTRTVLRTETHQGEGFNELRFEDLAGQEEIYIHGQKDLNVLIENDAAWHIKHDEHRDIDNERVTRIKANDHLTVEGERRDYIKADYSLTVDASLHQKLGQSLLVEAGNEAHHKAGMKIVMEAGAELTLKVGGSFVKIDAGGVTLSGGSIKMNSGGSPGAGSGWAGQMPIQPDDVEVVPPPPPLDPVRQIATLQSVEPVCELCEKIGPRSENHAGTSNKVSITGSTESLRAATELDIMTADSMIDLDSSAPSFLYHVTKPSVTPLIKRDGLVVANIDSVLKGATFSSDTLDKKTLAIARRIRAFPSMEKAKQLILANFKKLAGSRGAAPGFLAQFEVLSVANQYQASYQSLVAFMPREGDGYVNEIFKGAPKAKTPSKDDKVTVAELRDGDLLFRICTLAYVRSAYEEVTNNCIGKLYLTEDVDAINSYAQYKIENGRVVIFRVRKVLLAHEIFPDEQDFRAVYIKSSIDASDLEYTECDANNNININTLIWRPLSDA